MSHILALQTGTVLADDYRIERVLGAGGFGITYLAEEVALGRLVTIKEYFPSDVAYRGENREAIPKSASAAEDYQWGLDRFIAEAQTLAKFDHANIVKVYRYFPAHSTAYMVLQFEEGQSLKAWLKSLGRAPRQRELDDILTPLLDALDVIHAADFLHRDIAPDNIIIRKDGSPVLIDFGSARGEIAQHSRTLSALVKPGYSPYEQYAENGHRQGPWTDIYALAATLYHAISGKRPADAPSRVVKETLAPAREVALSSYRSGFLAAIDRALALDIDQRPASVRIWRGELLAPDEKPRGSWLRRSKDSGEAPTGRAVPTRPLADVVPPAPDAPGQQGGFLDFVDGLKKQAPDVVAADVQVVTAPPAKSPPASLLARVAEVKPVPALPAPATKSIVSEPQPNVSLATWWRRTPKPKPVRKRRALTPILFKLAVGATIAGLVVMFQDRLLQPRPVVASAPVAPSPPPAPPRETPPARPKVAQIETRSIVEPPVKPAPLPPAVAPAPPVEPPTTPREASAAPPPTAASRLDAHRGSVVAIRYSRDGRTLLTVGSDRALRVTASEAGTLARTIALPDGGTTALALGGRLAAVASSSGGVSVLDWESGLPVVTVSGAGGPVTAVAFLGDRLVVGSGDGGLVVYDPRQGAQPTAVLDGHAGGLRAVAVHPQSSIFATGGDDGNVRLWDPARPASVRLMRGGKSPVIALAYTPDGRTIAAGSADGSIRLWSPTSGRLLRVLRGPKVGLQALDFSPAGDLLATAWKDGTLRLSDTQRWRTIELLPVGSTPGSLAFRPDGRFVSVGAADGSVITWSAIVGKGREIE